MIYMYIHSDWGMGVLTGVNHLNMGGSPCHESYICVCVLHIKPFFLPVDVQHTQCAWRFFLLERYQVQALWSQNHDTEILHCNAEVE